MSYGMDPEQAERTYRRIMGPRAFAGRLVLVVGILAIVGGLLIVLAR